MVFALLLVLLPISGFHTVSFPFRAFPWSCFDAWTEKLDLAVASETRETQFVFLQFVAHEADSVCNKTIIIIS